MDTIDDQVITLLQQNFTRNQISEKLKIPCYQIDNIRTRLGIRPKRNRITNKDIDALKELISKGHGFIAACDILGRASTSIKDFASKHNISLDFLPQKSRKWTEEDLNTLKTLVLDGVKYRDIAKILKRDTSSIATQLKKMGMSSAFAIKLEVNRNLGKRGQALCRRCQEIKPLEDYYTSISKKICKNCCKKRAAAQRQTHKTDPSYWIKKRISEAKSRAIKYQYDFDLTFEWFQSQLEKQSALCFYTGESLVMEANNLFSVSIDRKDSAKGYTQDNCVLCGFKINNMKNDLSVNQFLDFCQKVVKKLSPIIL